MKPNLERRIAALEGQKTERQAVHIFLMAGGVEDDAIQGFQCGEHVIKREPGEPLESLEARTVAAIGSTASAVVMALYSD